MPFVERKFNMFDGLLAALPLADWLHVTVTPLEGHPNDPAQASR
jgi:muconolactone delta-isomerase